MKRIPDDLARDLVEWAADSDNAVTVVGKTVVCVFCNYRVAWHEDDCLHIRALYWLGAEKLAEDPDEAGPGMRAKVVNRD